MSWIDNLRHALGKTRSNFSAAIKSLLIGQPVDSSVWENIESALLLSDAGIPLTEKVMQDLKQTSVQEKAITQEKVLGLLKDYLSKIFPIYEVKISRVPHIILLVGVNGSGKTTTAAKLANTFLKDQKKVLLVAADTFRAAAADQLKLWGGKLGITVFSMDPKTSPSTVVYEGLKIALETKSDVVLIDTAGRLQNKVSLMDELIKIKKVVQKYDLSAPHEILLVLDATAGQNAILQAQVFNETLDITGIILTKLDGSAKGGVIFGLVDKLKVPVVKIGVGEGLEDLQAFSAGDFVEALFSS